MCLKQKITLALLSVSINQHLPNKKLLNLLANIHYFFLISHSLSFSLLLSLTKHTRTLPYTHRCIHAHIHALEETPTHMQQLSSNKKELIAAWKNLPTLTRPPCLVRWTNRHAHPHTHTRTPTHTTNNTHTHLQADAPLMLVCTFASPSLFVTQTHFTWKSSLTLEPSEEEELEQIWRDT